MTQVEFSNALGISQSCLSKIEDGQLEPSLETFRRAAQICDADLTILNETYQAFENYFWGDK